MMSPAQSALRALYVRTLRVIGLKSVMRRVVGTQRVVLPEGVFDLRPGLNASDRDIWVQERHPEPDSLAALLAALPQDRPWCLCDIGANSGTYIVPIAMNAPEGSVLMAFEPNPVMADCLRRNLELNDVADRVDLHRVALGEAEGEAVLGMPSGNMGQGSVRWTGRARRSYTVPMKPLAGFLTGLSLDMVFAIKIDVEGYEDAVLMPLLEGSDDAPLPHVILIEMVAETDWEQDLTGALGRKHYRKAWEGEGNALFTRPN